MIARLAMLALAGTVSLPQFCAAEVVFTNNPCLTPLRANLYHAGWTDRNKNGVRDPYEDPSLDVEARITDLLGRMTMDEKTAQMVTLYGFPRVLKDELPTPAW